VLFNVQEFTTSRFEMEDLFIHRGYKSNKLKVNLDKVSFKPKPFGINLILFVVDLTPGRQPAEGRGQFACPSLTFEGLGDHYVKLSMLWCRGWVRTESFHNHLVFILIIFFCKPIPSYVNLREERPVCISFNRRSRRSLHKIGKTFMQWCRGWVRTTRVATLSSRSTIAARLELRGKGEKKSYKMRDKRPQ
jgi:hypothetical protein